MYEKPKSDFQKHPRESAFFETSKTFIVRMGGWVGGDQKGPSIFLIFKYNNKKTVLILNMVLKVVYGLYIRSYEHFKFQN